MTFEDVISNGEVKFEKIDSEQKLKIICDDYFATAESINTYSLFVLCLMAYYMGKCDGLELEK